MGAGDRAPAHGMRIRSHLRAACRRPILIDALPRLGGTIGEPGMGPLWRCLSGEREARVHIDGGPADEARDLEAASCERHVRCRRGWNGRWDDWLVAQRKTLTQRQVDVLRWICDGCPDGVMTGEAYSERITAGALRNRGLVITRGSGASWSASITEAGVEYLAQVDGSNPPIAREPNKPASERLVDDVVAAGGSLRVPRRSGYGRSGQPDYERRVAVAEQRGVVPSGKRLVVTYERDALRIDLLDLPEGTPTQTFPVPVPTKVARDHAVVAEFRDERDRQEVSRAQLPRVSRILQALAVEAERRGYTVHGPDTRKAHEYGKPAWSGDVDGHLRITVQGVMVTLRVHEDGIRTRTLYPDRDARYRHDDPWSRRPPAYDRDAKGTVRISILAPRTRSHRRSSWGDGKRQTLEECLPAILMEVAARSAEERERTRLEQEEAERQQLAWAEAKDHARRRYTEHRRAEILDAQVEAWQHATAIRAYCDAIEEKYPNDARASEWVAWARTRADALDPLATTPTTPEAPQDVSPEDLRPFLDGWSPYRPERESPRITF